MRDIKITLRNLVWLSTIFLAMQSYPVSASYISNYSLWQKIDDNSKMSYAAGLLDALIGFAVGAEDIANASGLRECAAAIQLNPRMLVTAIEQYYLSDTDNWINPPIFALHEEIILGPCKSYINAEREVLDMDTFP